jgi:hypothetical protein
VRTGWNRTDVSAIKRPGFQSGFVFGLLVHPILYALFFSDSALRPIPFP